MSRGTVIGLVLGVTTTASAQQRPCDPAAALGPSRDLYCIELIAAPGIPAAGTVELAHAGGPFTVAVTPGGLPRYRLILSADSLPSPRSLGNFRTFVAWVAPPAMHPVRKLGEVAAGRTDLGIVDLEKFVVLVTAERNAGAAEPARPDRAPRPVAEHPALPADLLEFSIGRMGEAGGHHGHHAGGGDSGGVRWTGVPMPAGLQMLPAEMALRPGVEPYLPRGPAVEARPREVVRLRSGDTLRLEAGLVTRTLKGRSYTMFAFNGQYPGPLIEAARGAEITVAFSGTGCLSPPPCTGTASGSTIGTTACQISPNRRCRPVASTPTGSASPMRASIGITRTFVRISSRSWVSTAIS